MMEKKTALFLNFTHCPFSPSILGMVLGRRAINANRRLLVVTPRDELRAHEFRINSEPANGNWIVGIELLESREDSVMSLVGKIDDDATTRHIFSEGERFS
jgi:hypothetical protein